MLFSKGGFKLDYLVVSKWTKHYCSQNTCLRLGIRETGMETVFGCILICFIVIKRIGMCRREIFRYQNGCHCHQMLLVSDQKVHKDSIEFLDRSYVRFIGNFFDINKRNTEFKLRETKYLRTTLLHIVYLPTKY